jgi:hypothetical protein
VWRLDSRENHVVSVHLLEAEAARLRDAEDRVKIPAVPCFSIEAILQLFASLGRENSADTLDVIHRILLDSQHLPEDDERLLAADAAAAINEFLNTLAR